MSARLPLLRSLARSPGISFALASTFAVGVGLSTALFAYLAFFLFPFFDAPEPDHIAQIEVGTAADPAQFLSSDELRALEGAGAFEQLAGTAPIGATVTNGKQSQHAWGRAAGPDFFPLFGAAPAFGRFLAAADERPGAQPVVVLGHRLWRGLFGEDPDILGRQVELNGHSFTVVGIARRGFQGLGFASEFFVPLGQADLLSGASRASAPDAKWLAVWARIPPGTGAREEATTRATGALAGYDATSPLPGGERRVLRITLATEPGEWIRTDPYFAGARYLSAAAALFLLLASANVSGLLLARATARDREWAVRKALGASPARLAAAMAAEVAPAIGLGLAGAVGVAHLVMGWLERALITPVAGIGSTWAVEEAKVFAVDGRLLAFAAAAAVAAFAVAVGAPLVRVLKRPPLVALRDESAGGGVDRHRLAARRLLVILEISLSVVLVIGGALLARTLRALSVAEPGFDSHSLAIATVHLPRSPGGSAADLAAYRAMVDRARALPGVRAVTVAHLGPNSGWARSAKAAPGERPDLLSDVSYNIVGPGYFSTLGVRMLAGRELDERDTPAALPAVVISRAAAIRLFGELNVVGRSLRTDLPTRDGEAGPDFRIVGVSSDAGVTSASESARPWVFFAYGQKRHSRMTLVLRTPTPIGSLEPALRELVGASRSDASLLDLVSADEQLDRSLHMQEINAVIAGALATAGLVTALGGLLALQAYTVNLRRRDFAVRLALGARGADIARLVARDAGRLAAAGIVAGLAAAAAVTRLMTSLLYGVRPLDPWTFAAVPLLLAAAVALASWLPARRAARVDPAASLRAL